jgi:hypothetical protein
VAVDVQSYHSASLSGSDALMVASKGESNRDLAGKLPAMQYYIILNILKLKYNILYYFIKL